ncbi:MAG: hypothetical protein ACKPKO_51960 [Candidatus Fonsibacter sp.]
MKNMLGDALILRTLYLRAYREGKDSMEVNMDSQLIPLTGAPASSTDISLNLPMSPAQRRVSESPSASDWLAGLNPEIRQRQIDLVAVVEAVGAMAPNVPLGAFRDPKALITRLQYPAVIHVQSCPSAAGFSST